MTASGVEKFEAQWYRLGSRQRQLLFDAAAVLIWGGFSIALATDTGSRWWAAGAAALLVARRRTPSAVLVGVAAIQLITMTDVPLVLWCAAYTVGARGRALPGVLAIGAVSAAFVVLAWDPADILQGLSDTGFLVLFPALLGVSVRRSGQLATMHRDRADALAREQELVAERAVRQERDRMAREMHDVLGHKLSLISVQAGRLELGGRADARTAELLGATSREAMEDLRQIIGVLDADPRPKSVPELVECSRLTGMRIESRWDERMAALPKTLSDAAYRVVQEALTNVHKHAGPVDVAVECRVTPDQVRLLVRNGPGPRPPATRGVGTGRGLRSLTAQIRTLGGHLSYGPTGDGGFAVHAVLATNEGDA